MSSWGEWAKAERGDVTIYALQLPTAALDDDFHLVTLEFDGEAFGKLGSRVLANLIEKQLNILTLGVRMADGSETIHFASRNLFPREQQITVPGLGKQWIELDVRVDPGGKLYDGALRLTPQEILNFRSDVQLAALQEIGDWLETPRLVSFFLTALAGANLEGLRQSAHQIGYRTNPIRKRKGVLAYVDLRKRTTATREALNLCSAELIELGLKFGFEFQGWSSKPILRALYMPRKGSDKPWKAVVTEVGKNLAIVVVAVFCFAVAPNFLRFVWITVLLMLLATVAIAYGLWRSNPLLSRASLLTYAASFTIAIAAGMVFAGKNLSLVAGISAAVILVAFVLKAIWVFRLAGIFPD